MTDVPIDLAQSHRFLAALTGEANPAVTWQTFADAADLKQTGGLAQIRTMRLSAIERWLVEINGRGAGVFVCVNATDGKGRKAANVTALRALFIDCDGSRPLPTEWALQPSIVVQRGEAIANRWHAYWLLEPGQALDRFAAAQVTLACHWLTDTNVHDLPRVMRVPGFVHRKAEPQAVQLRCAHSALRYTIDQVLAAHAVDWAAIAARPADDAHRRAAEILGLGQVGSAQPPAAAPAAPARERPPARPPTVGEDADDAWHVAQFRKWAACKSTAEGAANPKGGRDNTAFIIACEGAARVDLVGGRFDRRCVEDVVREYLERAGVPGVDQAVQRIVASAFSESRRSDSLPVRSTGHGRGGGGGSAGGGDHGGGGVPPGAGGPGATAPGDDGKPPAKTPWDGLAVDRLDRTWAIGPRGVIPVELDGKSGDWVHRVNKRVVDLPIWPVRQGVDAATGDIWWLLAWLTPQGERREQWMAEAALKVGHELVALPDGPVTKQHCERCATWLTAARSAVTNPQARVTSRVGWTGVNGSRRWVWPGGEGDAVYIGGELKPAGELAAWRTGVELLAALPGDSGYPALCVLGFAVGAAFVRLSGRAGARNPVVGLMGASSTGKGSALVYALSAWAPPDLLTVPAMSTSKGLQDRAAGMPDLPLLVDDLQNLAERDADQASDALYYLANGQRRVTSSKEQKARGGELRYGVGFYAAEHPILPGMNAGANYRVIEITRPVCPTADVAKALQRAAAAHGALAGPLADHLASTTPSGWKEALDAWGAPWRAGGAADFDADALAVLHAGLAAVQAVLGGADLGAGKVVAWLAGQIAAQRAATVDRETQALHALLDLIGSGHWSPADSSDQYQTGRDGTLVAWRHTIADLTKAPVDGERRSARVLTLDINTEAEAPRRLLRELGGEQRILSVWRRRGWLKVDGAHNKCRKWHQGLPCGRVLKLTADALSLYYGEDV